MDGFYTRDLSKALQLVIGQLHNQGFFTYLSEQVACTVEELEAVSDVSPQALSSTLNLFLPASTLAYELIKKPISKDNSWYKKLWNLNLPDAKNGHALLIFQDNKFSLETYSNGIKFAN